MTSEDINERQTSVPIFLDGSDDLGVELREQAFALLALTAVPVAPATLAALSGEDRATVESALHRLATMGRIDRDIEGRVVGSSGLTVADGPHGLSFGGRSFRTWCAFDAIGIPASLTVDAVVETACAICGAPIRIDIATGEPVVTDSAKLWMSDGGADMRADFCTPTVLLCSDAHAQSWAERHGWAGEVLSMPEAAEVGGRNWASCAAAFVNLRERGASGTKEFGQICHDRRPI